jgi:hypothetical protein
VRRLSACRAVNLFFVLDSVLGGPFPHTFADLTPTPALEAWRPIHDDCPYKLWIEVEESPGLATPTWWRNLHPVVVTHGPGANGPRTFKRIELGGVLSVAGCDTAYALHHRKKRAINCGPQDA